MGAEVDPPEENSVGTCQAFLAIALVLYSPTDIGPESAPPVTFLNASLHLKVSLPGTRPLPVYGYTYIKVIFLKMRLDFHRSLHLQVN